MKCLLPNYKPTEDVPIVIGIGIPSSYLSNIYTDESKCSKPGI